MGNVGSLDAGIRAALQGNKSVCYVCPPAGWAVVPLFGALPENRVPGPRLLVLAPTTPDVLDLARSLRPLSGFEPILAVTGIARAGRLLGSGAVRTLLATPFDALQLLEGSRLAAGDLPSIALAWPELVLPAGDGRLLDSVLAEAPTAQRLIVTSEPAAVKDLIERHARRAPLAIGSQPGERTVGTARAVIVDGERRAGAGAVRSVLDTLNPSSTFLWEPLAANRYERWVEFAEDPSVVIADWPPPEQSFDLAVAVELPSAEALAALAASAQEVVVLVRASQVAYLQRLAKPLRTLRLPGPSEQARDRAHALRQAIRTRLEQEDVLSDLLALGPLFDDYDPALVAAALARGARTAGAEPESPPAWVRIRVDLGKRDRLRPGDLVGALINGVGLSADHVGRIEMREAFTIAQVRAEDAARALRGLAGLSLRGKTATVRLAD